MESVAFITANHGREDVLKIYCEGIERIKRQTSLRVESIIVGDENAVCRDYNAVHVPYNNNSVTGRFNIACQKARTFDVDAVIISGSDDLYNNELFNYIVSREEDFVGFKDIYLYSLDGDTKGTLVFLTTSLVGCGRLLSKSLLDRINWTICNRERLWGVDQVVRQTIHRHVQSEHIFLASSVGGRCVDLKSSESMNLFRKWKGLEPRTPNELFDWLSQEEKDLINKIINQ